MSDWYIDGKYCMSLTCMSCFQVPVDLLCGTLACTQCLGTDNCIGWSLYHVFVCPVKIPVSAAGFLMGTVIDGVHHTCLCGSRKDCCVTSRELICGKWVDTMCNYQYSKYKPQLGRYEQRGTFCGSGLGSFEVRGTSTVAEMANYACCHHFRDKQEDSCLFCHNLYGRYRGASEDSQYPPKLDKSSVSVNTVAQR